MSNLSDAEKQLLYREAFMLLALVESKLLELRAKHEQKEKELCYPIQVSPVGKPLC